MPDPVLGTGAGGQECSGMATRITALSISVSTGQNLTVHVHSEGGKGLIFTLGDQNSEYGNMSIFQGLSRF